MLARLHRTRRRLARATLAGFALFWALTALTPCVMAAQCIEAGMDMSTRCMHSGDHKTAQQHPCHPVAKADCQNQNIDQLRLDHPAPTDSFSLYTPVLLQTLGVATHAPGLHSALQHQRNATAVPHPPLNLKHANLLI